MADDEPTKIKPLEVLAEDLPCIKENVGLCREPIPLNLVGQRQSYSGFECRYIQTGCMFRTVGSVFYCNYRERNENSR